MARRLDQLPETRRARLFGGTGFLIFCISVFLSCLAYAFGVWRDGELFSFLALIAWGAFPIMMGFVSYWYWNASSEFGVSWRERGLLVLGLILTWVGSLWHLFLLSFVGLILSRGLPLPFIDQ